METAMQQVREALQRSMTKKSADEFGTGSLFRAVARTTGHGALVSPRSQGDRGVPRSLAGTPTTMEDGNHPGSSAATTAFTVHKVAAMALRLAVMHR
ncbi:hypothetical protein MTO96_036382, partial [Rhipicephalus appendiculatus]